MKRVSAMLTALTALGLGGGLLWSLRGMAPAGSAASTAAQSVALESQPAASAPVPSAPALPQEAAAARAAIRKRADAVRAQLRQELAGRIRHSHAAPAAVTVAGRKALPRVGTSSAPATAAEPQEPPRMPASDGEGNQADRPLGKYINVTLKQQFIPLAGGCYEELLRRKPEARGKLVLELEVVGDGSTGGVVNDVTLGKDTTFDDDEFATCVSESLYSTVFDAPPEDERSVTVSYPLELEP